MNGLSIHISIALICMYNERYHSIFQRQSVPMLGKKNVHAVAFSMITGFDVIELHPLKSDFNHLYA